MIEEPYRWVEAIANRRQYIEDQLKTGSPVVLLTYADGLLFLTMGRDRQKLFEVYDRVGLAALGHPADIERLRMAAIDLAHLEGFSRAVSDVSLRRLVNYGLSPTMKVTFEQIFSAPYIAKVLMAELGETPAEDMFYSVDYDGSFHGRHGEERHGVLAGLHSAEDAMRQHLDKTDWDGNDDLSAALRASLETWAIGQHASRITPAAAAQAEKEAPKPVEWDWRKLIHEELKNRSVEAAVLERARHPTSKFRRLDDREIRPVLKEL